MSEETLLSAARRVVRFMNIDQNMHGGLIAVETQHAIETLDAQVRKTDERDRAAKAAAAAADGPRLVKPDEGAQ